MTFPKDRDGPSNRGNKDARGLQALDVPFLTRRRLPGVLQPGTIARKRGDFLEVRLVPSTTAVVVSPFLWSVLFRAGTSASELRYRRYGWGARTTLDSVEQLRNPSYVPLGREWYVGGGYVLQHCAQAQEDTLGQWPTWLSLIAIADATGAEVLSQSADNKAGRNVSFFDRAPRLPTDPQFWLNTVDDGRPHAFVTGWDALAKGYGFGVIGRTVSASTTIVQRLTAARDGIDASVDDQYAMTAWWGDTASRQIQRGVELRGDTYRCAPAFVLHSVRPGTAMAFVTRYRTLVNNSNPESEQVYASGHDLGMLRTDDHGRSWTMEEVPEVKALLLRDNAGGIVLDGLTYGRTIPGLGFTVIAPLDTTGRLGAVVRISRAPGANIAPGDVPPDWPGPADRWTTQHYQTWNTRRAFLVSDTTGRNWVRKPWPLDTVPANIDGLFYDSFAYPLGAWVPFLSTAQVHNPAHTAGAGSFFVARMEALHETGKTRDASQHRARMVFTLDGGDTWAESALLPDALANDNARRVIWPIVAKPFVSLDSPGEIYLLAPTPARVRIFRTDATFATFTEVYDQAVENLYLSGQGQSDLNAVFIGDASGSYPRRVRPGFPEFDQP